MHDAQYMLRFAVILEAYLKGCGEAILVRMRTTYSFIRLIPIPHSGFCSINLDKFCGSG